MKKIKIAYIIWAILVIIIFGLLTMLGFMYKKKVEPYKELEFNLKEIAEKYVELEFLYPENGEEVIIKSEDLIKKDLMKELTYKKDTCSGYVELTYNGVYNYKSFIKCDNYITKGY